MTNQIRLYEELSLNSHVALHSHFYDGWIILNSNGYTGRANSVNVLYSSTIPIETKIDFCEKFYAEKKQDCIFKITDDDVADELDGILEQRGYKIVTPTDVMVLDLENAKFGDAEKSDVEVRISENADDWILDFCRLKNIEDDETKSTIKQMLELVLCNSSYCKIAENGKTIACASSVIERGYMMLHNVIVDKNFRGRGYGKFICELLLQDAKNHSAHTAYLQVVQDNEIAKQMYEKFGFRKLYSYWYRVK